MRMESRIRGLAGLAGALGVLTMGTAPAFAGRVTRGDDAGYEIHRIVSQYQGGASESIAPWEAIPLQPIQGETLLVGFSNLFPEGVKVETWRIGEGWKEIAPANYTFKTTVVTPE